VTLPVVLVRKPRRLRHSPCEDGRSQSLPQRADPSSTSTHCCGHSCSLPRRAHKARSEGRADGCRVCWGQDQNTSKLTAQSWSKASPTAAGLIPTQSRYGDQLAHYTSKHLCSFLKKMKLFPAPHPSASCFGKLFQAQHSPESLQEHSRKSTAGNKC